MYFKVTVQIIKNKYILLFSQRGKYKCNLKFIFQPGLPYNLADTNRQSMCTDYYYIIIIYIIIYIDYYYVIIIILEL